MLLRVSTTVELTCEQPTAMTLMMRPCSGPAQWVTRQRFEVEPLRYITQYADRLGNLCQRLCAPAGPMKIDTESDVHAPDTLDIGPGRPPTDPANLPDDLLPMMLASRYVEADLPYFDDLAKEVTAGVSPGYDQAQAIQQWIHDNFKYAYGTSTASTTARDTAEDRQGVCRDFTHLGLALCRALYLPSRMVVGYCHELDPMDQHAWWESYVDGRWWSFDATPGGAGKPGRVAVAYGRDAADVAFITEYGPIELTSMHVAVTRLDDPDA